MLRSMGTEFTPIFLFILVAIVTAVGHAGGRARCSGPSESTAVKQMPYESGMDPIGDARQRFDVRYYLVAIVFLLFDVELLFLYPWAVAQWSAGTADGGDRRRGRRCRVAGIPAEFRGLVFCEIMVFIVDPGGGVCLRLAERGVRMAIGHPDRAAGSPSRTCPVRVVPDGASRPDALEVPENTILTTLDSVVNWCRKYSLWPMPFATACCGIELMAVGASRFDIARFGAEVMRFSPRQCDLMIVAGRVAMKMMPVLQRIWLQMPEPKWCISMGACASTGGIFDTYAVVQGIDRFIPVDVYIPGCPPRPEQILRALMDIQAKIQKGGSLLGHRACPSCSSGRRCWPRSETAPPASPWPASAATRTGSAIACRAARRSSAPARPAKSGRAVSG